MATPPPGYELPRELIDAAFSSMYDVPTFARLLEPAPRYPRYEDRVYRHRAPTWFEAASPRHRLTILTNRARRRAGRVPLTWDDVRTVHIKEDLR